MRRRAVLPRSVKALYYYWIIGVIGVTAVVCTPQIGAKIRPSSFNSLPQFLGQNIFLSPFFVITYCIK